MNIKQLGRVLRKRQAWVAGPFLLATSFSVGWALVSPPWYQATAKLLLEQRDHGLAMMGQDTSDASQLTSLTRTGSPLETEMEVLQSASIVQRVIEKLQLQHPTKHRLLLPEEFLVSAKVAVVKSTDILDVSYISGDPTGARSIANTWIDVFLDDYRETTHAEATRASSFLEQQLTQTQELLTRTETQIKTFKERNGAVDVTEEAKAYILDLSALEVEERQAEAAYSDARTHATALQAKIGLSAHEALLETELAQSPAIQTLRAQLQLAESDPLLSQGKLTASHPEVQEKQSQVAALKQQLAGKVSDILGPHLAGRTTGGDLDTIRQGMTQDLVKAEVDTLSYQTRLAGLKTLDARAHQRLAVLPGQTYELTRLERDAAILADQFALLHKRLDETRISDASTSGNIRVIERAAVPIEPASHRKALRVLLGMLAGLLLGAGAAFLRDHVDETLRSVEEAEPLLGLSLGLIPWLKKPQEARLVAHERPRSPEAQAYRNLGYNMSLLALNTGARAFVFSSAGAGEGKTTTVANLGVSLAQTGRRVLVIDADMHCPALHENFGLVQGPGLAEVLAGRATLAQVLQPGVVDGLDVMGAGTLPANPAALLEAVTFGQLLTELKLWYDFVLFDAPPLLAVPDARILAAQLNGMIYVARLGQVSKRASQQVVGLMQASGLPILGTVLQGLKPTDDGFYDAYIHSYGQVLGEHVAARSS